MSAAKTSWGSVEAEDLFKIATRIAGFNARQLMLEIHRRQKGRDDKVNVRTVLNAMQAVRDATPLEVECDECGGTGQIQASCMNCRTLLTEGTAAEGQDDLCKACEEEAY